MLQHYIGSQQEAPYRPYAGHSLLFIGGLLTLFSPWSYFEYRHLIAELPKLVEWRSVAFNQAAAHTSLDAAIASTFGASRHWVFISVASIRATALLLALLYLPWLQRLLSRCTPLSYVASCQYYVYLVHPFVVVGQQAFDGPLSSLVLRGPVWLTPAFRATWTTLAVLAISLAISRLFIEIVDTPKALLVRLWWRVLSEREFRVEVDNRDRNRFIALLLTVLLAQFYLPGVASRVSPTKRCRVRAEAKIDAVRAGYQWACGEMADQGTWDCAALGGHTTDERMKASYIFSRFFETKELNMHACEFKAFGTGPPQAEIVVLSQRGVCLPQRRAKDWALQKQIRRLCANSDPALCASVPTVCESTFDRASYIFSKHWADGWADAELQCDFGGTAKAYLVPVFAGGVAGYQARQAVFGEGRKDRVSRPECIVQQATEYETKDEL
mmetsp:Transcript_41962/g.94804  ORF Transcript_41962/g.94804 Transcript_41962/m.94804 type:complete len:441 (-) Transcript_41962:343-1665(-)